MKRIGDKTENHTKIKLPHQKRPVFCISEHRSFFNAELFGEQILEQEHYTVPKRQFIIKEEFLNARCQFYANHRQG